MDPSNTGDLHGTVAEALASHAHHGGANHAHDHHAANDEQPLLPNHKPSTRIHYAVLGGMLGDSQAVTQRLEHMKNNIHHGDGVTRQRIEAWLERSDNDIKPKQKPKQSWLEQTTNNNCEPENLSVA